MIYELRTYWVEPAFLEGYQEWANTVALPILQGAYGFRVVGFWVVDSAQPSRPTFPAVEDPFTVAWLIAWKDEAEREATWSAVRASPEWAAAQRQAAEITSRIAAAAAGSSHEARLRDLANTSGFMGRGSTYLLHGITRSPLQ